MSESPTLFVFWQDPANRRWLVVGRLSRHVGSYRFVYTKGATISKNFIPFGRMNDLYQEYQSANLLPLFSNRVLSKSRPEYSEYLEWLALDNSDPDPLAQLARTGGLKGTDSLSMYPAPVPDEQGNYRVVFFCHGIRYVAETVASRIKKLMPGDRLYPMHDMQNASDKSALALRSADPSTLLGYCPRFFAKDFRSLLRRRSKDTELSVVRVNPTAPIEYRLLCEFKSPWPQNFRACEGGEYESLATRAGSTQSVAPHAQGLLKNA